MTRPRQFGLALLALAVLIGCDLEPDPPAAAPPVIAAPGAFIPDAECRPCHRTEFRTYRDVGMSRSFMTPKPGEMIEDFLDDNTLLHDASGRYYEMTQRDDGFFVTRYRIDDAGRQADVLEQRIDFIIGSGDHSRGYLYRTPADELFELPVAWSTQSNRWDMAPGYDRPDHDGFNRQVTRTCMFCHNAYPPDIDAGTDQHGQRHVFPADLPHGIGCQRCHGPGRRHVELANDLDASDDEVRASILAVRDLPADRRDDVCYQCHLQPSSKRTSFVRRFGVDEYAFRPGQSLDDAMFFFDFIGGAVPREDRFEINHHPYRLDQSRCATESDGALSCLTCHDPHVKVPKAERAAHYRDACLTCHDVAACDLESMLAATPAADVPEHFRTTATDDCVSCHMPTHRTEDVVHVVMTDHRIQRRPDHAAMLAPKTETSPPTDVEVVPYRDYADIDAGELAMARVMSAVNDGDLSAGLELRALIERLQPDAVEPYIALGTVQLAVGDAAGALVSFDRVIELKPDLALGWANRGAALLRLGRVPEALDALRVALQRDERSPEGHFNLGVTLAQHGAAEDAERHLARAVALRPNYARAEFVLGNLDARAGRLHDAIAHYERATAIDPRLAAAYATRGAALRDIANPGADDELWRDAAAAYRRALELEPNDRHAAQLIEINVAAGLESPENATQQAEQLVLAQPRDGNAWLVLTLARLQAGRQDLAADALERAGAANAAARSVRFAAALIAQQRGDLDAAQLERDAALAQPDASRPSTIDRWLEALGRRIEG